MNTAAVVAVIGTVLVAVVTGLFANRAAVRTAQPNAQTAINAGFTALSATQVAEIGRLTTKVTGLEERQTAQETRLDDQARQISALQARESRYKHVLRTLLEHVHQLRAIISDAGRPVPPDPVRPDELDGLLD